jgi:ankyrin repeat protein
MTPEEATHKLFDAARSEKVTDARAALDEGADLTARDEWQATPLHWAAGKGHTDLARLLIEELIEQNKGADLNARDDRQRTPLHWAALNLAYANGHTDLVKMLQDAAKDQPGHVGREAKRRDRDNDAPQIG